MISIIKKPTIETTVFFIDELAFLFICSPFAVVGDRGLVGHIVLDGLFHFFLDLFFDLVFRRGLFRSLGGGRCL